MISQSCAGRLRLLVRARLDAGFEGPVEPQVSNTRVGIVGLNGECVHACWDNTEALPAARPAGPVPDLRRAVAAAQVHMHSAEREVCPGSSSGDLRKIEPHGPARVLSEGGEMLVIARRATDGGSVVGQLTVDSRKCLRHRSGPFLTTQKPCREAGLLREVD